jgi:hypothetical protein
MLHPNLNLPIFSTLTRISILAAVILVLLWTNPATSADRTATAEDGTRVVLHDDGRWESADAASFRLAAETFIKAFGVQDVKGLAPFLPPSVAVTIHAISAQGNAFEGAARTETEVTGEWTKFLTCGDEMLTGTVSNVSGMWCSLLFSYCGYSKCSPDLIIDASGHRVMTAGYSPTRPVKGIAFTFEPVADTWMLKIVELNAYFE